MLELRKKGDEVKIFVVFFHCFLECMYLLMYLRFGRHGLIFLGLSRLSQQQRCIHPPSVLLVWEKR